MIVNANDRRVDTVATGSTPDFDFDFAILADSDIAAYWNGVPIANLGVSMSVAGEGDEDGGTVTFTTTPPSGAIVTLIGGRAAAAQSRYVNVQTLPLQQIENDFAHAAILEQQAQEVHRRALRAPIADYLDMVLPSVAARRSRVLGFDTNGLPTAIDLSIAAGGDVSLATVIATGTVTARALATRFAEWYNVKDFGALGNDIADDSAEITAALAAIGANGGAILLPSGLYAPRTTIYTLSIGTSVWSLGNGGLGFSFNSQDQFVNNRINPKMTSTLQQVAFWAHVVGTNILGVGSSGAHPARIAAVLSAESGGGLGAGSGEPLRGLNIVVTQHAADTMCQMVGLELSFNNNGTDATLNMAFPNQVGLSINSGGSKRGGIALSIGGTGTWMQGIDIAAGGIAAGGLVAYYRGDGSGAKTKFAIARNGAFQFGFAGTTVGADGAAVLFNEVPLQGVKADGSSEYNLLRINNADQLIFDEGALGVHLGGALIHKYTDVTYATVMDIDAKLGDCFDIVADDGVAFKINDPIDGRVGQRITIRIFNHSGTTLGTVTWGDTAYKMATFTKPANQTNRAVDFLYNGAFWYEVGRNAADIPD